MSSRSITSLATYTLLELLVTGHNLTITVIIKYKITYHRELLITTMCQMLFKVLYAMIQILTAIA